MEHTPLVRTCFSKPLAWRALRNAASRPYVEGFQAYLTPISHRRFSKLLPQQVAAEFPDQLVIFIADRHALRTNLILCIDGLNHTSTFRARIQDLWLVENNVSTGNLLFEEFLYYDIGPDGVLKGYDNL